MVHIEKESRYSQNHGKYREQQEIFAVAVEEKSHIYNVYQRCGYQADNQKRKSRLAAVTEAFEIRWIHQASFSAVDYQFDKQFAGDNATTILNIAFMIAVYNKKYTDNRGLQAGCRLHIRCYG